MNEKHSLAQRASHAMHEKDISAQELGIEILSIGAGRAALSMFVKPQFANGYGICQGGLVATLADAAFAHACNSYNRKTVALNFCIDFVRPAIIQDTLTATACELSRGKVTGIYEVKVTNQKDKLVAVFKGTSYEIGDEIVSD